MKIGWLRGLFVITVGLFVSAFDRAFAVELADEAPSSVVQWICPDEPFPDGIKKTRYYRRVFQTREGLVKALARWWIDDVGSLYVDGGKVTGGAMSVDHPADLTATLKQPGRHVLAVEGRNLAGSGGVCLLLDLEYADGRHESVYTDKSWCYAPSASGLGWTSIDFDDSQWQHVRAFCNVLSPPWTSLADMSQLMLPAERQRRSAIFAARQVRVEKAMAAMAREQKPVCKIVYENGKSYFDIGGRRFETSFYNASENWNCDSLSLRRQATMFRDAGVHLYGIGVQAPRVWREDGTINFADVEKRMQDVLSVDPEAHFQICVACDRSVRWWNRKHPDEMVGYATGAPNPSEGDTIKNFLAPSLASIPWRRDVADFLRRFVAHLESSPYAKRIYAYRPDYGVYHEWHYFGMARDMPDTGKAMTAAFRRCLERQYKGDVEALRRAWNKPDVTFATAEIPSKEERLRTSAGNLRDPVKDRPTLDYLRCHAEQVRDCLLDFNRAMKEACGGRALLGNYCGYFFEMPFPAEGWHLENEAILDSPYVDFQVTPFPYQVMARGGGNVQYSRRLLEATRRRGKLAIMEADTRTTLIGDTWDRTHLHSHTREEDIALMARDFVSTLCWGCGFWYYDFGQGWYDAPEFGEFFKKIYPIRREITDCRSVSEVLVVGDYESVMFSNAGSSRFNDERTFGLVNALGHTGVPFDSASIVDLASGKLKDYRMYIFCNLHYKTPDKERLVAGLREKGKTVIIPETPLTTDDLRKLFAEHNIHIWDEDPRDVIYASAACVALHTATPGEKTIRLPRRAKVTMLYPERREIAADTDRIVFTPIGTTFSTTLFRTE
ncbi:MAG: hypothetical protein IKR48_03245 [Kiritimatiellae bacterium]|nr:hypothetical protein [Kiritimatiellia bacterium]